MISLIIPPKDQVSRVNKMLTDEYGTASNIKSRVNRYFYFLFGVFFTDESFFQTFSVRSNHIYPAKIKVIFKSS